MQNIQCNLCGFSDFNELKKATQDDCQYLQCRKCGLCFINPIPHFSKEQKDRLNTEEWGHNRLSLETFTMQLNAFRGIFQKQMYIIERYTGKGRLLDVGCGNGSFLKVAAEMGWETYGLDISKLSASFVSEKLGLNCFHGLLEQTNFPDGYFHAIRLRHILEHQEDPSEFLKRIWYLLKDNGIVIIDVPNANGIYYWLKSLLAHLSGNPAYCLLLSRYTHLYAFSIKTLYKMMNKIGFKVLNVTTVARRAKSYFPLPEPQVLKDKVINLLDWVGGFINMGSVIVMYVQK